MKRGYEKTITTLYNETDPKDLIPKTEISNLIGSVNEIREKEQSGLIEWWRVFWDILKETKRAKKVKRGTSSMEGESEAFSNTTAPKRIRKKQSAPASPPILDTLDMNSLTGIEKSLTSSGLMNKDLNKLTALEAKRIEIALRSNKVSKEAWDIYLKLCKEFQRIPQNIQVPVNNKAMLPSAYNTGLTSGSSGQLLLSSSSGNSMLSGVSSLTSIPPTSVHLNPNYMGVIDQVNQPIDSKQLLIFRQSLYQEYLKKQQAAISMITKNVGNSASVNAQSIQNMGCDAKQSMGYDNDTQSMGCDNNTQSMGCDNNTQNSVILNSPPNGTSPTVIVNGNFPEEFFYEFINEYLI